MNVSITGRHLEITQSLKDYINKKTKKLDKYFNQIDSAHIVLYIEKLDNIIEMEINGDRIRIHGVEKSKNMYSSVDLLVDKMEKQIVKSKKRQTDHKAIPIGKTEHPTITNSNNAQVFINKVIDKPIDEIEAYLEMKMDNRDFILFKKIDKSENSKSYPQNNNYAIIYRGEKGLKYIEIPMQSINEQTKASEQFKEYDFIIMDDSSTNFKFRMNPNNSYEIKRMAINDAIREITDSSNKFMPFLNHDTNFINIIYWDGKNLEIMVPSV